MAEGDRSVRAGGRRVSFSVTVVIGDKEINAGKLVVRDRNEGKQREVTLQELIDEVKAQTKDKPYLPLNLPTHLSTRPQIMV